MVAAGAIFAIRSWICRGHSKTWAKPIRRNSNFSEAYYRRASVAALQQDWVTAIGDGQCFYIELLPDDPRTPGMRQAIAEWRYARQYGRAS